MRTEGRTDGHDEANCRFSQFCERPSKLMKNFEIVGLWKGQKRMKDTFTKRQGADSIGGMLGTLRAERSVASCISVHKKCKTARRGGC